MGTQKQSPKNRTQNCLPPPPFETTVVYGGPGGCQLTKVNIGGANELLWSRGLIIGATLDVSWTFLKSGGSRGTLRWFKGAQRAPRVSKVDIGGANKLLWPRGLIIGVTLDASQTFSKSGDLRGHLKVV